MMLVDKTGDTSKKAVSFSAPGVAAARPGMPRITGLLGLATLRQIFP